MAGWTSRPASPGQLGHEKGAQGTERLRTKEGENSWVNALEKDLGQQPCLTRRS